MNLETLSHFFMWSSIINLVASLLSFVLVVLGGNLAFKVHSKLFKISEKKAAENIHSALINYKTFIFIFNIIPWIVIQIIK